MSKAILVFDMPPNCSNCCQSYDCYGEFYVCAAEDKALRECDMDLGKPEWCPLIKAPEEQLVWFEGSDSDYERGYNNCLHSIIGESEILT